MREHQIKIFLCEFFQILAVRDDVSHIIVIVLNVRLLSGLLWITVEYVRANLAGLIVDLEKIDLLKLRSAIRLIPNSG